MESCEAEVSAVEGKVHALSARRPRLQDAWGHQQPCASWDRSEVPNAVWACAQPGNMQTVHTRPGYRFPDTCRTALAAQHSSAGLLSADDAFDEEHLANSRPAAHIPAAAAMTRQGDWPSAPLRPAAGSGRSRAKNLRKEFRSGLVHMTHGSRTDSAQGSDRCSASKERCRYQHQGAPWHAAAQVRLAGASPRAHPQEEDSWHRKAVQFRHGPSESSVMVSRSMLEALMQDLAKGLADVEQLQHDAVRTHLSAKTSAPATTPAVHARGAAT